MSKRILLSLSIPLLLAFTASAPGQSGRTGAGPIAGRPLLSRLARASSEREQDGLSGPVRRVRTETARISTKNGKPVEGQRVTLEVAAYDVRGAKIENAYYPVSGAAITGKEVYKYDDKGNIVEMTLQDEKGTLLSKETYTYEFDQFGNWIKMTTSVAVIENGKLTFEPTEVTYRTISYYLDEATLARMNQPAQPQQPAANQTATGGAAGTVATGTLAANNTSGGNASTGNSSAPATNTQPIASKPSQPVARPGVASNNSSTVTSQQPQTANNRTALSTDSSRQSTVQPTTAPVSNSSAPVVKTSAPASDKPAETKSGDEMATRPVIKPLLKPVSGGVLNGKAVSLPKPVYPLAAKSTRMSGVVVVEVVIDVNGKVISARAVSGPGLLQQAAVQAAYQAKFSPTTVSDQPVKVMGTISYNFALSQ